MTPSRRHLLRVTGALSLAVVTAGCGLKAGAVDSLRTSGGGAQNAAAGGPAGASGAGGNAGGGVSAVGPGGSAPAGAGSSALAAGGAGAGQAGSGGAAAGSGSGAGGTGTAGGGSGRTVTAAGGACGVPHGGTTTGVTASDIFLGLHAPLTGTGTPFPNNSFKTGAGVFWKQPGHQVCGRNVNVEFQDDTYTPTGAHQVCGAMATRDFLVVGGGGTDQIQACATDPNIQRLGVPYLSAGVTTNGLTNLNNYFAVSLSYEQQGTLVVRNAQNQGFAHPSASSVKSDNIPSTNAQWAIVTAAGPNFDDATRGIQNALKAANIPYKTYRQSQNGDYQSAATQFGSTLALDGFKTIFVDAAPGYFVFMSGGYYGASTGNAVNWVGPGVTYTEVTVAQYVCSGTKTAISGHAWFLAPAPGIDRSTKDFQTAYGGKYDDIEWSLWGLSQTLFSLLKQASGNLTRQNFIASTQNATVPGGVYPPLDYRAHGGHFGGTGAWVQRVNCNETEPDQSQPGQWDTVGSSFLRLY